MAEAPEGQLVLPKGLIIKLMWGLGEDLGLGEGNGFGASFGAILCFDSGEGNGFWTLFDTTFCCASIGASMGKGWGVGFGVGRVWHSLAVHQVCATSGAALKFPGFVP